MRVLGSVLLSWTLVGQAKAAAISSTYCDQLGGKAVGGSCYQWRPELVSWEDAYQICAGEPAALNVNGVRGRLAHFYTAEAFDAVWNPGHSQGGVAQSDKNWIGLRQGSGLDPLFYASIDSYVWVDGPDGDVKHSCFQTAAISPVESRVNMDRPGELCVRLKNKEDGKMEDKPCDSLLNPICEFVPATDPETSGHPLTACVVDLESWCTAQNSYLYVNHSKSCFFVGGTNAWVDGEPECSRVVGTPSLRGRLGVLNDMETWKAVSQLLPANDGDGLFIGAQRSSLQAHNDSIGIGHTVWRDGPLGANYLQCNSLPLEPGLVNLDRRADHCLTMHRHNGTAQLWDEPCDSNIPHLCEIVYADEAKTGDASACEDVSAEEGWCHKYQGYFDTNNSHCFIYDKTKVVWEAAWGHCDTEYRDRPSTMRHRLAHLDFERLWTPLPIVGKEILDSNDAWVALHKMDESDVHSSFRWFDRLGPSGPFDEEQCQSGTLPGGSNPDKGMQEPCFRVKNSGKYEEKKCEDDQKVLCEFLPDSASLPEGNCDALVGFIPSDNCTGGVLYNGFCFWPLFDDAIKTKAERKRLCAIGGGYPAAVWNSRDITHLSDHLPALDYFTGLHKDGFDTTQEYVDWYFELESGRQIFVAENADGITWAGVRADRTASALKGHPFVGIEQLRVDEGSVNWVLCQYKRARDLSHLNFSWCESSGGRMVRGELEHCFAIDPTYNLRAGEAWTACGATGQLAVADTQVLREALQTLVDGHPTDVNALVALYRQPDAGDIVEGWHWLLGDASEHDVNISGPGQQGFAAGFPDDVLGRNQSNFAYLLKGQVGLVTGGEILSKNLQHPICQFTRNLTSTTTTSTTASASSSTAAETTTGTTTAWAADEACVGGAFHNGHCFLSRPANKSKIARKALCAQHGGFPAIVWTQQDFDALAHIIFGANESYLGLYQDPGSATKYDKWYFERPNGTQIHMANQDWAIKWAATHEPSGAEPFGMVQPEGLFDTDGTHKDNVLCQYPLARNFSYLTSDWCAAQTHKAVASGHCFAMPTRYNLRADEAFGACGEGQLAVLFSQAEVDGVRNLSAQHSAVGLLALFQAAGETVDWDGWSWKAKDGTEALLSFTGVSGFPFEATFPAEDEFGDTLDGGPSYGFLEPSGNGVRTFSGIRGQLAQYPVCQFPLTPTSTTTEEPDALIDPGTNCSGGVLYNGHCFLLQPDTPEQTRESRRARCEAAEAGGFPAVVWAWRDVRALAGLVGTQGAWIGQYQDDSSTGLRDKWFYELHDGTTIHLHNATWTVPFAPSEPNQNNERFAVLKDTGVFDVNGSVPRTPILCQYPRARDTSHLSRAWCEESANWTLMTEESCFAVDTTYNWRADEARDGQPCGAEGQLAVLQSRSEMDSLQQLCNELHAIENTGLIVSLYQTAGQNSTDEGWHWLDGGGNAIPLSNASVFGFAPQDNNWTPEEDGEKSYGFIWRGKTIMVGLDSIHANYLQHPICQFRYPVSSSTSSTTSATSTEPATLGPQSRSANCSSGVRHNGFCFEAFPRPADNSGESRMALCQALGGGYPAVLWHPDDLDAVEPALGGQSAFVGLRQKEDANGSSNGWYFDLPNDRDIPIGSTGQLPFAANEPNGNGGSVRIVTGSMIYDDVSDNVAAAFASKVLCQFLERDLSHLTLGWCEGQAGAVVTEEHCFVLDATYNLRADEALGACGEGQLAVSEDANTTRLLQAIVNAFNVNGTVAGGIVALYQDPAFTDNLQGWQWRHKDNTTVDVAVSEVGGFPFNGAYPRDNAWTDAEDGELNYGYLWFNHHGYLSLGSIHSKAAKQHPICQFDRLLTSTAEPSSTTTTIGAESTTTQAPMGLPPGDYSFNDCVAQGGVEYNGDCFLRVVPAAQNRSSREAACGQGYPALPFWKDLWLNSSMKEAMLYTYIGFYQANSATAPNDNWYWTLPGGKKAAFEQTNAGLNGFWAGSTEPNDGMGDATEAQRENFGFVSTGVTGVSDVEERLNTLPKAPVLCQYEGPKVYQALDHANCAFESMQAGGGASRRVRSNCFWVLDDFVLRADQALTLDAQGTLCGPHGHLPHYMYQSYVTAAHDMARALNAYAMVSLRQEEGAGTVDEDWLWLDEGELVYWSNWSAPWAAVAGFPRDLGLGGGETGDENFAYVSPDVSEGLVSHAAIVGGRAQFPLCRFSPPGCFTPAFGRYPVVTPIQGPEPMGNLSDCRSACKDLDDCVAFVWNSASECAVIGPFASVVLNDVDSYIAYYKEDCDLPEMFCVYTYHNGSFAAGNYLRVVDDWEESKEEGCKERCSEIVACGGYEWDTSTDACRLVQNGSTPGALNPNLRSAVKEYCYPATTTTAPATSTTSGSTSTTSTSTTSSKSTSTTTSFASSTTSSSTAQVETTTPTTTPPVSTSSGPPTFTKAASTTTTSERPTSTEAASTVVATSTAAPSTSTSQPTTVASTTEAPTAEADSTTDSLTTTEASSTQALTTTDVSTEAASTVQASTAAVTSQKSSESSSAPATSSILPTTSSPEDVSSTKFAATSRDVTSTTFRSSSEPVAYTSTEIAIPSSTLADASSSKLVTTTGPPTTTTTTSTSATTTTTTSSSPTSTSTAGQTWTSSEADESTSSIAETTTQRESETTSAPTTTGKTTTRRKTTNEKSTSPEIARTTPETTTAPASTTPKIITSTPKFVTTTHYTKDETSSMEPTSSTAQASTEADETSTVPVAAIKTSTEMEQRTTSPTPTKAKLEPTTDPSQITTAADHSTTKTSVKSSSTVMLTSTLVEQQTTTKSEMIDPTTLKEPETTQESKVPTTLYQDVSTEKPTKMPTKKPSKKPTKSPEKSPTTPEVAMPTSTPIKPRDEATPIKPRDTTTTQQPLSSSATSALTELLGLAGDLPPSVSAAAAAGDPGPLVELMETEGLRPNADVWEELKGSQGFGELPEEVQEALAEYEESHLPQEAVDELVDFAGQVLPPAVQKALDEGDPEPYTEWLESTGQLPLEAQVAALVESAAAGLVPQDIVDDVNEWLQGLSATTTKAVVTTAAPEAQPPSTLKDSAAALAEALGSLLDLPGGLPPTVTAALAAGDPDPLVDLMEAQDVRPSAEEWAELAADPVYGALPEEVKEALDGYKDAHLPEEAVDAVVDFAGQPVPKGVLQSLDAGDTEPLTDWLETVGAEPSAEQWEALQKTVQDEHLPEPLYDALKAWSEGAKLDPESVDELEKFAGKEIPPNILAAVDEGKFDEFTKWLEQEELRFTKNELARLKAGEDVFSYPEGLTEEVANWADERWYKGAVKELDTFAGEDVPEDVIRAAERNQSQPFIDWLVKHQIEPSPADMVRLDKRSDKVAIPESFVDEVREWWDGLGQVITTSSAPTTGAATERSLGPGETTTPPFPLSPAEEVAASIMQSMGCAALIGILAATLVGYALIVRDPSTERFIHMNQELSLLLAHILVLTMRDRVSLHVPCKLVAVALQSLFLTSFSFMTLEAFHAYSISSSMIPSGGVMNKRQLAAVGWLLPAVYSATSAILSVQHYKSFWSCWLNMGHQVALASFVPAGLLAGAAVVMVEAGGMDAGKALLEGADPTQRTAALSNQKGLLFVLPTALASWAVGSYAVFAANVALYGTVFALNLSLALAIFAFHTLGNPKVLAYLKKFIPCL